MLDSVLALGQSERGGLGDNKDRETARGELQPALHMSSTNHESKIFF